MKFLSRADLGQQFNRKNPQLQFVIQILNIRHRKKNIQQVSHPHQKEF